MSNNAGAMTCERHAGVPATIRCSHCGRPICRQCVEEFGYFCGQGCLGQARASVSSVDKHRRADEEAELERYAGRTRQVALAVAVLVVLLLAGWCWRTFVRPPGKVCWTWQYAGQLADLNVLAVENDQVTVLAGGTIVVLDAESGRELRQVAVAEDIDAQNAAARNLADGLLVFDRDQLLRMGPNGNIRYRKPFGRHVGSIELSRNLDAAWYTLPATYGWGKDAARERSQVSCLDLTSGGERWSYEPEDGYEVASMLVGTEFVFVLETAVDGGARPRLAALHRTDGSRRWRMTFPAEPSWGPAVRGDHLIVVLEGTVHVFSTKGHEEWSRPAERVTVPCPTSDADCLFVPDSRGTACVDLASGETLWQAGVKLDGEFLAMDGEKIFASGIVAKGATPGKPKPPGFEDLDSLMEKMGGETPGGLDALMVRPAFVCIDRKTGKVKWRTDNVVGRLIGNCRCLVHVVDTSETSLLQMVAGGRGVTIVQQFDPADGRSSYRRQLDLGFKPAGVTGKRLIGVAYERREEIGIMQAAHGKQVDEETLAPPGAIGIVGIRLE